MTASGDEKEERTFQVEQELLRQSERATRLMLQGDLQEAEGVATRALSINPKHVPSACALARILCRKGKALHDACLIEQAGQHLSKYLNTHLRPSLGEKEHATSIHQTIRAVFSSWGDSCGCKGR